MSFGVDYLTAVQDTYGSDVQKAVSEASSNNVDLRLKEFQYVVVVLVSGHQRELQICFGSSISLWGVVVFVRLVWTDDIILPQQRAAMVGATVSLAGQRTWRGWTSPPSGAKYPFMGV